VLGDSNSAIPWIERAMRIDPFSANRYYLSLARALFMAERSIEAIEVLDRNAREHYEHYALLAACHSAAGHEAQAREAARHALALRPNLSVATVVGAGVIWKRPEDKARLADALARAGLPA